MILHWLDTVLPADFVGVDCVNGCVQAGSICFLEFVNYTHESTYALFLLPLPDLPAEHGRTRFTKLEPMSLETGLLQWRGHNLWGWGGGATGRYGKWDERDVGRRARWVEANKVG